MKDLEQFKNEMSLSGKNVYVGHRYVPKIFGEWDKSKLYEPLSIVQYQGASYTSRQYVPVGVEITNEEFWVATGNYNAQIEQYRQDVRDLNVTVGENVTAIDSIDDELKNVNEKISNIGLVNILDFGAKTDVGFDNIDAINAAIDYAKSQGGGTVFVPAGTFWVNPTGTEHKIVIKTGVNLLGTGASSIIKVINNNTGFFYMLSSDNSDENSIEIEDTIYIEKITFDSNTKGNPVAPSSTSPDYSLSRSIFGLYSPHSFVISECRFEYGGVHAMIVVNYRNGRKITIKDNYFHFNINQSVVGYVNFDNTACYIGSKNHTVRDNVFISDYTGTDKNATAVTAIESHYNHGKILNNTTVNYRQGLLLTGGDEAVKSPSDVQRTIMGNHFLNCASGIGIWPNEHHYSTNIANNIIYINFEDRHLGDQTNVAGISLGDRNYGGPTTIMDTLITNNQIVYQITKSYTSTLNEDDPMGFAIGMPNTINGETTISNLIIRGNLIKNTPRAPINFSGNSKSGPLSNIVIEDNNFVNSIWDKKLNTNKKVFVTTSMLNLKGFKCINNNFHDDDGVSKIAAEVFEYLVTGTRTYENNALALTVGRFSKTGKSEFKVYANKDTEGNNVDSNDMVFEKSTNSLFKVTSGGVFRTTNATRYSGTIVANGVFKPNDVSLLNYIDSRDDVNTYINDAWQGRYGVYGVDNLAGTILLSANLGTIGSVVEISVASPALEKVD